MLEEDGKEQLGDCDGSAGGAWCLASWSFRPSITNSGKVKEGQSTVTARHLSACRWSTCCSQDLADGVDAGK